MTDFSAELRRSRLADAGWSDVQDRILAGLCHDLIGRVTSLAGMVQLLQLDEDSSSMAPFLDEEVQRLERSVRLVRGLAGEPNEEPEPIHLPEILPELRALFSKHRFMEVLEVTMRLEDGLIPTRGRWTLTGRAVLLLLSLAGWEALRRDRRVEVTVSSDEARLMIAARAPGEVRETEVPPEAAQRAGMPGIAELLGGGWSEKETPNEAVFTLELQKLTLGA